MGACAFRGRGRGRCRGLGPAKYAKQFSIATAYFKLVAYFLLLLLLSVFYVQTVGFTLLKYLNKFANAHSLNGIFHGTLSSAPVTCPSL